jgi:hypothetical protein
MRIEMTDWQPIETAPTNGPPIDIWAVNAHGGWRFPDCVWKGDAWTFAGFALKRYGGVWATHWMPLPEAPAQGTSPREG